MFGRDQATTNVEQSPALNHYSICRGGELSGPKSLKVSKVAGGRKHLKVEEPKWIRIEIRWRTITASDETDWPFFSEWKLVLSQDEQRRGPQITAFSSTTGHSVVHIGTASASRTGRGRITANSDPLRNPVPSTQPIADRLEQASRI